MARGRERGTRTRVLIALEDEYRAYREVIAAGIEALRPGTEVVTVGPERLGEELARLDPGVVVCSRPEPAGAGGGFAWVELPLDPIRPMKVRPRGGRRFEASEPTLEALLGVVDAADGGPPETGDPDGGGAPGPTAGGGPPRSRRP